MFLSRNRKNNTHPCKSKSYYIKVGFRGSKLYIYFRDAMSVQNKGPYELVYFRWLIWFCSKNILIKSIFSSVPLRSKGTLKSMVIYARYKIDLFV